MDNQDEEHNMIGEQVSFIYNDTGGLDPNEKPNIGIYATSFPREYRRGGVHIILMPSEHKSEHHATWVSAKAEEQRNLSRYASILAEEGGKMMNYDTFTSKEATMSPEEIERFYFVRKMAHFESHMIDQDKFKSIQASHSIFADTCICQFITLTDDDHGGHWVIRSIRD
jgi:hypothetical protein